MTIQQIEATRDSLTELLGSFPQVPDTAIEDLSSVPSVSTKEMLGFLSVIHHQSFTNAAQHLGISQPGLSRQIQRIEKAFGGKLLERGGREVEPTFRGVQVAAWCHITLRRMRGL
tara:strand:- start:76 stop:420 length:345 start_codon:yes stop_codon:yes gene_type:complete